jgi:hypothetical protein
VNQRQYLAARARASLFGPRRMTLGARLAVVALVLFSIGMSAYTRHLVDERVRVRVAQNCASWGADETLFNITLSFPGPPPADQAAADRSRQFRRSLEQARDTKIELRRKNNCPPWPPAPAVPPIPRSTP